MLAKIQQSLPEIKRDGSTVLSSLWADLIHAENSTFRFGGVLPQAEFIPKLVKTLQESPEAVIADFEKIRKSSRSLSFSSMFTALIYVSLASH